MIIIDGRESNLSLSNYGNLEEVLTTLMEDEALEQRIVTDVLVDDEAFSELYPHQAEDIETSSLKRLELRTVSMGQMAEDVVAELPKVVDIMDKGGRRTAELLRQSELAEGLEVLQDIIAVSRDLLNTVHVLRIAYAGGPIQEIEDLGNTLGDLLGEIGDVMENEDWMLVADLVEYELIPACEGWRDIIGVLQKAVDAAKAA